MADPCCCCGDPFDPDDEDPEYSLCFGCLNYHKIHKNICVKCYDDEIALHASRFWDNLHATEQSACTYSAHKVAVLNSTSVLLCTPECLLLESCPYPQSVSRSATMSATIGSTLSCLLSLVLLVTLISIQFGTAFTKKERHYLFLYSQL